MLELENDAARLRSISYLLGEALRVADEGRAPLVRAKIAESLDCVDHALADVTEQLDWHR